MAAEQSHRNPIDVAAELAQALEKRGIDYALGGALALGYWARPRGTVDVDLTLYLSPDVPSECVRVLQDIGCDISVSEAIQLLDEHGFCRARFDSTPLDIFFPTIPFYEVARGRRQRVPLKSGHAMVWDAETIAVFKMMFFREKDLVDLKQILRNKSPSFDPHWVRQQLVEIYGARDIRISRWDEIVSEVST